MFCGIPLFSPKALGQLDPPNWTNFAHKPSPTSIHTAQVPDPSWVWSWPEWHINKDEGVDENGWEYSFMFAKMFSWHPPRWYNSCVRRRAWTRQRVKRDPESNDPHMLNTEYFTVRRSVETDHSGGKTSSRHSRHSPSVSSWVSAEAGEKPDIEDIETLMAILTRARIDREKIEAVENFLQHGGDDLVHLQHRMHDIMAIFVFQASRRVLLSKLNEVFEETQRALKENDTGQLQRRSNNLKGAIRHADEECRRLEYWSDVKKLVREGKTTTATDKCEGWNEDWRGVDQSGPWEEEAERQHDDANEAREPPVVRRVEVAGQTEEARELRAWLSETPKRERKKTKGPKTDLDELEESLERSKLAKSVFVKPALTYPNKRESRKSWRAHQESISAQVYFDRNVQNLLKQEIHVNPDSTDWRHVLSLLVSKTPEESVQWIEDGMKIQLSERKLAAIMDNGGDERIGAIRRRTGASIKVSRADSPSASSTLLVSGTRAAINSATSEFRRIAGRITITRLWAPLAPDEAETESFSEDDFFVPPLTREEGGPWQRVKVDYDAYTTPWPTPMSFSSFEQYVASLTDSVMLPHLNSVLYNPARHAVLLDHERAVARRLKRAFTNYEARPWISCSALKLALSFLCRRGDKYLPEVRSIFASMDRFGLRMDADVFNMMLRAPTSTRHLRKFRQTLLLMTRRGFAPNLDTWILFLRMFESVEVKSYILQAMHSKNLLGTPEAIQRVAEEMAPLDTEHALSQGKDLSTFLQEQSDRYGPDWLTRDAANQVLDVLCRHGRFQDAFVLLDHMHAHLKLIPAEHKAVRIAHMPDVITFNTIISHAKTHGKMPVAVNAVRKMKTTAFATQADRVTFGLLFEMAWKSRLRSAVSIIWKYASLARLTTWQMRQRVAALINGRPKDGERDVYLGISASTYAQLGGERLARDLVGGEQALAKIRSLAEGRDRVELGVLAAKCWPEAFCDFGPMVSLAHVLSQAVLTDLSCLAMKNKRLTVPAGEWPQFRPKAMPLRRRARKQEIGLGDLAPLEDEGPEPIRPGDKWVHDALLGYGKKKLAVLDMPSEFTGAHKRDSVSKQSTLSETQTTTTRRRPRRAGLAILDCEVWVDIWGEDRGADAGAPLPRHELQRSNENDVLAALGRLEENYLSFPEVVSVADDEDFDSAAAERPRDALDKEIESDWMRILQPETSSDRDAEVDGGGEQPGGEGDDSANDGAGQEDQTDGGKVNEGPQQPV
ncbi:putative meiotically up-regulated 65 protein [Diaporthe ampelina]|uniref:Putative meiotically up-regulated 65 protein n=1 Tax=Diaporthe ampelina TaxID=1214573 RepID=A0A0G2FBQ6_9PEZI|nr:putative meiotically up-regulated 65 protein [Diaporthe ampelina]